MDNEKFAALYAEREEIERRQKGIREKLITLSYLQSSVQIRMVVKSARFARIHEIASAQGWAEGKMLCQEAIRLVARHYEISTRINGG